MTSVHQPVEQRLGGRRYLLSSVRELMLGVCCVFRLFYVAPETTARFSRLDDRSRNRSPPCVNRSTTDRLADVTALYPPACTVPLSRDPNAGRSAWRVPPHARRHA